MDSKSRQIRTQKQLPQCVWMQENYPGCERVIIKPFIPESLPYVKSSIETIRGKVSIHWENNNSELSLKVEIPANMVGEIYVPVNKEEGDSFLDELNPDNRNINFLDETDRYRSYLVDSGEIKLSDENEAWLPAAEVELW